MRAQRVVPVPWGASFTGRLSHLLRHNVELSGRADSAVLMPDLVQRIAFKYGGYKFKEWIVKLMNVISVVHPGPRDFLKGICQRCSMTVKELTDEEQEGLIIALSWNYR